jgi:hypothetical protein
MFSATTYSQMQKGDKYIGFQAFIFSQEGNTFGNFSGLYAENLSKHFVISAGPGFTIQSMQEATLDPVTLQLTTSTSTTLTFSIQLDIDYYFSSKSRLSPFVGVGIYGTKGIVMLDTDVGINYFISKNLGWKTVLKLGAASVNAGTDITGEESSTTVFSLLFTTGLNIRL